VYNWPIKKLGEVLDYEQPGQYIVSSKNYSNDYKTPVLTAGKTFILGNTNEKEGIFPPEKLPVIIFDDFTTAIKFVDFPFKVKSSAMKILHAKKDIADIKYIFYLIQTIGINHVTHKRYWISEYSQIEIPMPPIEEQRKIVKRIEGLFSKIDEAQKLRKDAQKDSAALLSSALHHIFSQGKEKGWEEKNLSEICDINPSKKETADLPDSTLVSFVPMTAVDEYLQSITKKMIRSLGEVKKGYTFFRDGDVLLAKITPCMENGKVALANNLLNGFGFGTTEFHVIRVGSGVLPEWIYQIIRQPLFREEAKKHMTGSAGQKRVPREFLEKFKIFLPPLAEQKKIVEYLDLLSEKVNTLQKLQTETVNDFIALKQSILHKAFSGELLTETENGEVTATK